MIPSVSLRVRVWARQSRYTLRYGPPAQVAVFAAGAVCALMQGTAVTMRAGPDPDEFLTPLITWLPVSVLGAAWILAGVLLALGIVSVRVRITGLSLLAGLCTAWGLAYWWSWIAGGLPWGWTAAAWFTVVAVWAGALPAVLESAATATRRR